MAEKALRSGECNCMYCGKIISKRTAHRTCRDCFWKWAGLYGQEWYKLPFHAELVKEYDAFIGAERLTGTSLEYTYNVSDDQRIESRPSDDWLPATQFTEAFKLIKDRVLYYHALGIRVGATRLEQDLHEHGVSPIPKPRAIEKYKRKILDSLPPSDPDDPRLERDELFKRLLVLSAEIDGRMMGGTAPSAPLTSLIDQTLEMPLEDDYAGRAQLLAELVISANGNAASLVPVLPTLTHLAHDVTYALSAGRL